MNRVIYFFMIYLRGLLSCGRSRCSRHLRGRKSTGVWWIISAHLTWKTIRISVETWIIHHVLCFQVGVAGGWCATCYTSPSLAYTYILYTMCDFHDFGLTFFSINVFFVHLKMSKNVFWVVVWLTQRLFSIQKNFKKVDFSLWRKRPMKMRPKLWKSLHTT